MEAKINLIGKNNNIVGSGNLEAGNDFLSLYDFSPILSLTSDNNIKITNLKYLSTLDNIIPMILFCSNLKKISFVNYVPSNSRHNQKHGIAVPTVFKDSEGNTIATVSLSLDKTSGIITGCDALFNALNGRMHSKWDFSSDPNKSYWFDVVLFRAFTYEYSKCSMNTIFKNGGTNTLSVVSNQNMIAQQKELKITKNSPYNYTILR